jgi:L,D-peptidoglycan transpeptidase YkuD (ErfK/YbiS/YcfS/YnhG family)
MKKIVVVMLCVVLALSMFACKNSGSDMENKVESLSLPEGAEVLFVVVQDGASGCNFYALEKDEGKWSEIFTCDGYLGWSGVCPAENKREGDGATPDGLYSFGELFGNKRAPVGVFGQYTKIEEDDYWDSDPSSDTYNQHVKGGDKSQAWHDRGLYEHLIKYQKSYAYAVMINYNVDPVVAGNGSAIFMHCTTPDETSSAGCVAIPEEKMAEALSYIDENAYILIVGSIEDLENYI